MWTRFVRTSIRLLVLAVALMLPLSAASAFAHDYIYWYVHPQNKTYPTTLPGPSYVGSASNPSTKTVTFTAARAEYEGRQIVVRPTVGAIRDVWLEPSDLVLEGGAATIDSSNVEVFKVDYVTINVASAGFTRKGQPEPDPLIPMTLANGQRLGWKPFGAAPDPQFRTIPGGRTQPYYVLFHIPETATPGIYHGTVRITAEGSSDAIALPDVLVPVKLEVYPFSIAKRTLKTSFGISLNYAMYANTPDHKWLSKGSGENRITETTDVKGDQIGGWLKYFSEHRISPQTMLPAWSGATNGTMTARDPFITDYLGTGQATTFDGTRFDFNTAMMPEPFVKPTYLANPFANSTDLSKATAYYKSMASELAPWLSKAYVYPIDEPPYSSRAFIERYAAFIHSVAPGVKFLLTTDPVTMKYVPLKGVDIYVQRLHFYYRDYSKWISPLRSAGKQIWLYTHAGSFQTQAPNYLIDGTLHDVRAHGWFAYHTGANGLLYFNVAAWRLTKGSSTYRDAYKDPLSNRSGNDANGDGSLVYPGHYPSKGLVIQGAPPVGSLRMEALRDGLEDYEYLKLVEAKKGRASTLTSYAGRVIGAPKTVISAQRPTFPAYPRSSSAYDTTRADAAKLLKLYY